ncbi:MAG: YggS family pyridoxal phosphate-dependent enzyme [Clostridiales bacterium]|jgi:pyridoxal phosphate enzyme (YggS family)|nr:YggS family pyridoxal phosphate-dependent enzyme [Clostridiales bacterium]
MDCIQNILNIKERVKDIARENGTDAEKITLIAAVKTQTTAVVRSLSGVIGDAGENRVQEFLEHYDEKLPFKWHFIGRLQTNKVKYLIGKNVLIHSLDRVELAREIDRLSMKNGVVTECLAEVNIGGEESKGGVSAEEFGGFIDALEGFGGIAVSGIMSVLPRGNLSETEGYYAELRELFERAKKIKRKNFDCKYLSAGMSNDYETAIKYGANMIRLGTAIFGERVY